MKRPEDLEQQLVLDAVAPLLQLLELDPKDVRGVNVTPRQVTARVQARSPRGKVLPGVTVVRVHRIVAELED